MNSKELEQKFTIIDEITSQWSQGDFALGLYDFFLKVNSKHHIATSDNLDDDEEVISQAIDGFCVVSQTCDIVRECKKRPYIEVVPLVKLQGIDFIEVTKGLRANYVYVPSLKDQFLVADLERVMTIEKSCLKEVQRKIGCNSDNERRSFARALARKRARFAFPDDFNILISKLRKKLSEKHRKETEEGKALRDLREIRVSALPSWISDEIDLHFYFVRHSEHETFDGTSWESFKNIWISYLNEDKKYKNIIGEITTLEIMSAKEYIESDQLDLDHLSGI